MLLEMAAPDAIARLPASGLKGQARDIWNIYFHEQQHSSLAGFMNHVLTLDDFNLDQKRKEGLFIQVSTASILLLFPLSFVVWTRKCFFRFRLPLIRGCSPTTI